MDAETLKKLLELEEKKPGTLNEMLSRMEDNEQVPASLTKKAQLRQDAYRRLEKHLGPRFSQFLSQGDITGTTSRRHSKK